MSVVKQTIFQIVAFILISATFALIVNNFRSDAIPIIGEWSVDKRFSDSSGNSMTVSLEQAKELFEKDSVLFLDARPKDQYDEGHIKGALSFPQQEADSYFMQNANYLMNFFSDGGSTTDNKIIITYCDGETCELSHDLALFLKEMGFNNVKVLVNGWSLWQEAGLPKEIAE